MADVAAALTASWQACWWMLDDPEEPDRLGKALRLFESREVREHAEVAVSERAAAAAASSLATGRGGELGYADPVGSVVAGPAVQVIDEQRQELLALEADIAVRAGELREATQRILYDARTGPGSLSLRQAAAEIVWCSTAPHTTVAAVHHLRLVWRPPLVWSPDQLAWSVEELWHRCQRLQRLVLAQLERASAPPARPPSLRPKGCESCARDGGFFEPLRMDAAGKVLNHRYCKWCEDWRNSHGRRPPLGVLRARHEGRRVTSKVIDEALAAERRGH